MVWFVNIRVTKRWPLNNFFFLKGTSGHLTMMTYESFPGAASIWIVEFSSKHPHNRSVTSNLQKNYVPTSCWPQSISCISVLRHQQKEVVKTRKTRRLPWKVTRICSQDPLPLASHGQEISKRVLDFKTISDHFLFQLLENSDPVQSLYKVSHLFFFCHR